MVKIIQSARSLDLIRTSVRPHAVDHGLWQPVWTIDKFIDHRDRIAKASRSGLSMAELKAQFDPSHQRLRRRGNLLLNEGINELWALVCGTGATLFDNTHAYIGVGDSSAAEGATQTDLQASSNKTYKAMDGGYPTYGTSQYATWRSTFATGDANYAWNEITVSNTSSGSGKNLNRKVSSMGTKTSAASWVATLQVTLT